MTGHNEGDKGISRRKLLASIGMAGAAFAAEGLLSRGPIGFAGIDGESVTSAVYDGGGEAGFCGEGILSATIAGLQVMSCTPPPTLYYVTDSGKEGMFAYDPADTAAADDAAMVVVTATGARYKRILTGSRINVKWFGAKGDGAADDSAGIQQANDYAAARKYEVYFPAGTYKAYNLRPTASWLADGNAVIRNRRDDCTTALDRWLFVYVASAKDIVLDGLTFDGNVAADPASWNSGNYDSFTGSIACAVQNSSRITIRNCVFQNSYMSPLRLQESADITVDNCIMRRGRGNFGDCLYMDNCHNVQIVKCFAEDYTRIGFVAEHGCTNITFSQCWARKGHDSSILYGGGEYTGGFWAENSQNVTFSQCVAENNRHRGFIACTGPSTPSLAPTTNFYLKACVSLDNKETGFLLGTWTNHPVNIVCDECYSLRSEKGFLMTIFDHRDVITLTNCYAYIPNVAGVDSVAYALQNYEMGTGSTVTAKINIIDCVSDFGLLDYTKLQSQTSDMADFACLTSPVPYRSSGGGKAVITIDNFVNAKQANSVIIKCRKGDPTFRINNSYVTIPIIQDFKEVRLTNCVLTTLDHELGNAASLGNVTLIDSELQGGLRITTKGRMTFRNTLFRVAAGKALSLVRSGVEFTQFSDCRFEKNMTTAGAIVQIDSTLAAKSRFFFHDCLFYNTVNTTAATAAYVDCSNSTVIAPYFSGCYSDDTVPNALQIAGTLSAPAGDTVIPMH